MPPQDSVEARAHTILTILERVFELPDRRTDARTPFETLIVTVLSQNTHHRNTTRAFDTLSHRFPITPEALSKADETDIASAIKVAGPFHNKARVINTLAKIVQKRWGGSLSAMVNLPVDAARAQLRALPGVGPKTADVMLLFSAHKPIVPVDTHVNRISKRLGLVPAKANYEAVRHGLETLFAPAEYYAVHVLLIALGRRYCRARNPACAQCPVNTLCPSRRA